MIRTIIFISLMFYLTPSHAQLIDDFPPENTNSISPTQLSTPKAKLPSSVTVISRSELSVLGISNIVDALKLVPGMSVTQSSTYNLKASYHGTNGVVPRRMEVLVDGMSIRTGINSTVFWNMFPVSISDIERIEITRNPDSPRNGANSFQATINFITRHPADVQKNEVVLYQDTNDLERQSLMGRGHISNTHFYIRAENTEDAGFDTYRVSTNQGIVSRKPIDGQDDKKLTLRTNTEFSDRLNLGLLGGVIDGRIYRASADVFATGLNDETFKSSFINASLTFDRTKNDSWSFKAYLTNLDTNKNWDTCYPTFLFIEELRAMHLANPQYASTLISGRIPTGGSASDDELAMDVLNKVGILGASARTPQCGNINENFTDVKRSLSIENTHIINEQLQIVSGVEYRPNYAESQTFFGGKVKSNASSIFSSFQYDPNRLFTFNVGALYSKDQLTGFSHTSPLLGVSYHFLPNHTIKAIYLESFRDPNLLEKEISWSYRMEDFSSPLDQNSTSDFYKVTTNTNTENLRAENMASSELSLNGSFPNIALQYDVRIFREYFKNLISQDINFNNLNLNNDSTTKLEGAEAEAHYLFSPKVKLSFGASYIENESSNVNEISLHTPSSGFISASYIGDVNSASLSYYTSKYLQFSSLDRVEATFGQNYSLTNYNFYWQMKVRTQSSDYVATLGNINATGTGRENAKAWFSYKNDLAAALKLGVTF